MYNTRSPLIAFSGQRHFTFLQHIYHNNGNSLCHVHCLWNQLFVMKGNKLSSPTSLMPPTLILITHDIAFIQIL